jgi:hypothetical protein
MLGAQVRPLGQSSRRAGALRDQARDPNQAFPGGLSPVAAALYATLGARARLGRDVLGYPCVEPFPAHSALARQRLVQRPLVTADRLLAAHQTVPPTVGRKKKVGSAHRVKSPTADSSGRSLAYSSGDGHPVPACLFTSVLRYSAYGALVDPFRLGLRETTPDPNSRGGSAWWEPQPNARRHCFFCKLDRRSIDYGERMARNYPRQVERHEKCGHVMSYRSNGM